MGKIVRIAWFFLLSMIMADLALSDDTATESQFIFQADQVIQGNGFFGVYKNISFGQLSMENKGYGSGNYNAESMTKVQNDATHNGKTDDYSEDDEQKIKYDETVDFSYAPMNFDLGKSFNGVQFKKLGKMETCVKNYAGAVSMNALFDSASFLSKNLSADLWLKGETNSMIEGTDDDYELIDKQEGFTKLNVDAAFTGKGHVGALSLNLTGSRNVKSQVVDYIVDEDYIGTYHMTKKMSQAFNRSTRIERDQWLPCCTGGYADMNMQDAKALESAKGVFDCTCFGLHPLIVDS